MSRQKLKRVRLNERGADILRVPRRDMVELVEANIRATDQAARWKLRFLYLAAGTALVIGASWVYVIIK